MSPPHSPAPATAAVSSMFADDLVARGWSQQSAFLPAELTITLAAECRQLALAGGMHRATVGRSGQQAPAVRGDAIHWLGAGQSVACDRYLTLMETLRLSLNRSLYLGLDSYESHFAVYAPGAAYQKHVDRFRDDDRRTVSVVIYLNADWRGDQGGALRLHPERGPQRDIAPHGSHLVLFLSADMAHEVLPATRERLSLAGWFRRR